MSTELEVALQEAMESLAEEQRLKTPVFREIVSRPRSSAQPDASSAPSDRVPPSPQNETERLVSEAATAGRTQRITGASDF